MKAVPIFICAKDRNTMLKAVVDRLHEQGYDNLTIIDTGSTWPGMLEYLDACGVPVERVEVKVLPHRAIWSCGVLEKHGLVGKPYVYTDCDVMPDEGCPDDWCERLAGLLEKYPKYAKAGLGLRIDDLPVCYDKAQRVRGWEARFWSNPLEWEVYEAEIDTTLALYRGGQAGFALGIRTGGKYVARHLPWYSDTANLSREDIYYRENRREGHW
jgi:hypothetical protein